MAELDSPPTSLPQYHFQVNPSLPLRSLVLAKTASSQNLKNPCLRHLVGDYIRTTAKQEAAEASARRALAEQEFSRVKLKENKIILYIDETHGTELGAQDAYNYSKATCDRLAAEEEAYLRKREELQCQLVEVGLEIDHTITHRRETNLQFDTLLRTFASQGVEVDLTPPSPQPSPELTKEVSWRESKDFHLFMDL